MGTVTAPLKRMLKFVNDQIDKKNDSIAKVRDMSRSLKARSN